MRWLPNSQRRAMSIVSARTAADKTPGAEKAGERCTKSARHTIGINNRERYGQSGVAARAMGPAEALSSGCPARADMAQ